MKYAINIIRGIHKHMGLLAFDNLLAGVIAILLSVGVALNSGIMLTAGALTVILCASYMVISTKFLAEIK